MIRRLHRKVWIAWGPCWAAQIQAGWHFSLGVHLDVRHPYLDLHIGWLIVSIGRNPVVTNERDRLRGSCRGFLFRGDPLL